MHQLLIKLREHIEPVPPKGLKQTEFDRQYGNMKPLADIGAHKGAMHWVYYGRLKQMPQEGEHPVQTEVAQHEPALGQDNVGLKITYNHQGNVIIQANGPVEYHRQNEHTLNTTWHTGKMPGK